jgi:hypothetical protein
MCRAKKKSREGDHFGAAIGLRAQLEGFAPTIPDWANDRHTLAGKRGAVSIISARKARS